MLKLKKALSISVVLCIFLSCFSASGSTAVKKDSAIALPSGIFDGFKVTNSSYKPDSHLVILINDLHSNPQVQKSIFGILEKLYSLNSLKYIFAEGAPAGKVNTSAITYGNESRKKKVMEIFLLSGLAGGAEAFSICNDFEKLYGIEDWATYYDNIRIAASNYNNGIEKFFFRHP